MSFSDILEILRRYGNFRDNHLLIIRALLNAEMSAEELCRSTGIPKGRIYEFLNYILDNRIVLAKGKHPKKYYIDSPQDSIARFLEKRFSDISIDEVSIRNIMANHKRVITVNNKDDYTDVTGLIVITAGG